MLEFHYILAYILSTQVLQSGALCKASYAYKRTYSTHVNATLSGKSFIKSFTAKNQDDCENECFLNQRDYCYKYNYNNVSRLCGLMSRRVAGSYRIFEAEHSVVRIRKCAGRDCHKATQCFLIGNAKTTCLCPPPLNVTTCEGDGWLKVNNESVCFGAKSDSFGKVSIPYDGKVIGLKLRHVSGGVKTVQTEPLGYWGTGGERVGMIETIVTDHENKTMSPKEGYAFHAGNKTYPITDYTNMSPEVELPGLSVEWVKEGHELRLWIIEDLVNIDESDNSGITCADVYLNYEY